MCVGHWGTPKGTPQEMGTPKDPSWTPQEVGTQMGTPKDTKGHEWGHSGDVKEEMSACRTSGDNKGDISKDGDTKGGHHRGHLKRWGHQRTPAGHLRRWGHKWGHKRTPRDTSGDA